MRTFRIVFIIFLFFPLFCFAQKHSSENGTIIYDIQSYIALREQYDSLYKELISNDKRIKELTEQENAMIDEIENYPYLPDELDENGEPTSTAKEFREKNIEAIRERVKNKYTEIEAEIASTDSEELISLKTELKEKLQEITEKQYEYFDNTENDINYRTEITPFINISQSTYYYQYKTTSTISISDYPYIREGNTDFKQTAITFVYNETYQRESIPFYSKGIFSIKYDEENDFFTIDLINQIYYLTEDNSIIDITKLNSKLPNSNPTTNNYNISENTESKPDTQKTKRTVYKKDKKSFAGYGGIDLITGDMTGFMAFHIDLSYLFFEPFSIGFDWRCLGTSVPKGSSYSQFDTMRMDFDTYLSLEIDLPLHKNFIPTLFAAIAPGIFMHSFPNSDIYSSKKTETKGKGFLEIRGGIIIPLQHDWNMKFVYSREFTIYDGQMNIFTLSFGGN